MITFALTCFASLSITLKEFPIHLGAGFGRHTFAERTQKCGVKLPAPQSRSDAVEAVGFHGPIERSRASCHIWNDR
jgi:hypothetical protein